MLVKHVISPFSSIYYIFSVNYIFLMNITYVFAIITCLRFLVSDWARQPQIDDVYCIKIITQRLGTRT